MVQVMVGPQLHVVPRPVMRKIIVTEINLRFGHGLARVDEPAETPSRPRHQGAVSIRKTVLPGMAIPMLKIRRPNGRLIFNMEIAIRR